MGGADPQNEPKSIEHAVRLGDFRCHHPNFSNFMCLITRILSPGLSLSVRCVYGPDDWWKQLKSSGLADLVDFADLTGPRTEGRGRIKAGDKILVKVE